MSRGFGSTFGVGATDGVALLTAVATPTSLVSFSGFIYINGNGGGNAGAILRAGSGSFFISINATQLILTYGFSTINGSWNVARPSLSAWHHFCITYNPASTANNPVIYVDGVSQTVTRSANPSGSATSQNTLTIGNNAISGGIRNFDGMICQLGMWSGIILSTGDILSLLSGIFPIFIQPNYLTFYTPLDGISKPEIDYVNGFTSTITGTRLGTSDPPTTSLTKTKLLYSLNDTNQPFLPAWALNSNSWQAST